jgi:hypothetical protein
MRSGLNKFDVAENPDERQETPWLWAIHQSWLLQHDVGAQSQAKSRVLIAGWSPVPVGSCDVLLGKRGANN